MFANDLAALRALAAPCRATLALGVLLMVLESAAALAVPWLGGQFTAALLPDGTSVSIGPRLTLSCWNLELARHPASAHSLRSSHSRHANGRSL